MHQPYLNAVSEKAVLFTFEGHDFVPSYAKYLIEFLDYKFRREVE